MIYLRIDTDDLQAMDVVARATMLSQFTQNGIMTRNEARAKQDLPPSEEENADSLTVQSNLVPIEKLGEMGGQPTVHLPGAPGAPGEPPTPPPPAQKAA
jgi:hypothetical protein